MFSILLFLFHFSLSRIINTEILEDKHCNVSNFLMYPNNQTAIYFSQPDLSMFYQVTIKWNYTFLHYDNQYTLIKGTTFPLVTHFGGGYEYIVYSENGTA